MVRGGTVTKVEFANAPITMSEIGQYYLVY